jgi:hypothetical protein
MDGGGSGAWMYLLSGGNYLPFFLRSSAVVNDKFFLSFFITIEKRWTLYEPKYLSALYSVRTRLYFDPEAPHDDTIRLLPFASQIPSSTVFMKGGDLIWVPPGWAHRVLTTQKCMGIGAFYVHPAIAVESVKLSLSFLSRL